MTAKSLLSLTACSVSMAASAQNRPNILWLTYEDTSPQFIGCYGNKQAKTPNIDKLAGEGVRFESAFSTGAVSSASRFCLITGLRPASYGTGNHRSTYAIPPQIKGFPYYLRQAGYYTTNNSKTDYNIANAKAFTAEAWNESSGKAGWWNRKPGQPFFAVYNSNASHQSRTMTDSWTMYEKNVLNHLDASEKVEPGNLEIPDFYRNSPEMQKNISRVYNSISLMDKEFGEWMKRLEKDGLKDSTIIFCFSDHGQGITRSKGSALATGYKVAFVAWFPPMYKHLSPWGSGVITDELVSFDDFAPTMLKLCGVALPDYMKGRVFAGTKPDNARQYVFPALDRTDESSELSRSVSDGRYLYTRVFMPFQPFVRWNMYYDMSDLQQQIRAEYNAGKMNKVQKIMFEPRQSEYLFDLKNDKWETQNLAQKSEFRTKLTELRSALVNELIEKRDAHFMPEYSYIQQNKMPVVLASNNTEYPVAAIISTAMLVGEGKEALKQQMQKMNDGNKYIRYWAAVGLFSQPKCVKIKEKELLALLSKESYEPTRVYLSVLLYKQNSKKINLVRELLQQTEPELLRTSLQLLITLDDTKQNLIMNDIVSLSTKIEGKKGMFACSEFIKMFRHKNNGLEIKPEN